MKTTVTLTVKNLKNFALCCTQTCIQPLPSAIAKAAEAFQAGK